MKPAEKIEKLIKKSRYKAGPEAYNKALGSFLQAVDAHKTQKSALTEPNIWRTIMKSRITKIAAAAVIALVVLGGITLWPGGDSNGGKWWLGSPKVWAQEILAELGTIEGITCRERTLWIEPNGSTHTSMTWNILYVSKDSYRRDIYDGDRLREIQWYVPDGDGTLQHSVRYDLNSYFSHTGEGSFGDYAPVERMRFYVNLLDEADRLLGEKVIDGYNCVGFEISVSKYGDNPQEWLDRIWFDVETKLPVLIEQEIGRPRDETKTDFKPRIRLQDQFDYNPDLSADTFIPVIPEGFIFGHPDDIRVTN